MAIKVTLTNKAQRTTNLATEVPNEPLRMDRIVYQGLRSLTKNKHIPQSVADDQIPSELMELFTEFDKMSMGETVPEYVKRIDEYLGSLGVFEEYHYEKDIVDIPPRVTVFSQSPNRNVVTGNKNNKQNIVFQHGGTIYNVIHKTGG